MAYLFAYIPGIWDSDKAAAQTARNENTRHYFFKDNQALIDVEVKPHDPAVVDEFRNRMADDIEEKEFAQLDTHTHVVFLLTQIETPGALSRFMKASAAFIQSGGMGINILSSQTAFTSVEWLTMVHKSKKANLFKAFAGFVQQDGFIQSCGMHCLSLPDARIAVGKDEYYAYNLLRHFLFMGYQEGLDYQDGQEVSLYKDEPAFVIQKTADTRTDELFHNPYGVWALKRKDT